MTFITMCVDFILEQRSTLLLNVDYKSQLTHYNSDRAFLALGQHHIHGIGIYLFINI